MATKHTFYIELNEETIDNDFIPGPELAMEMVLRCGHQRHVYHFRIPQAHLDYYRSKSEEYLQDYLRHKRAKMFEILLAQLEAP